MRKNISMKYFLKMMRKVFCYIFITIFSLSGRVIFSPTISDWLWYSGTIEYPLSFYFYNKRLNFCWDIGMTYTNRYADVALSCQNLGGVQNLSYLFHGSDDFVFTDFQPQTANISTGQDGTYEFFPSYVFNESSCNINLQVSKDFEYKDGRYLHSTARCIIPFAKQSVVNVASGNMSINTTVGAVVRKKKGLERDKFLAREKSLLEKRKKVSFSQVNKRYYDSDILSQERLNNDSIEQRAISSPYIRLVNGERGQKYFAIQGTYFNTFSNDIFDYNANPADVFYLAYNKNGAPGYFSDSQENNLSLDELCHSYSLLGDNSGNAQYGQLVGYDGNVVQDADGLTYTVQNSPFQSTSILPGNALISFYSYGHIGQDIVSGFYVNNDCGLAYPLATAPSYISDVQVGDLITSSGIVFGDGLTGNVSTINLPSNNVIRVVATGPYGNNPYLNNIWERDQVAFEIPPVVVQYSPNGFPINYEVPIKIDQLQQAYSTQAGGVQFDFYGDYLLNNVNNNNPRLTVLNTDGTFYDSSADCAVLWYQNDYTNLFYNPTDEVLLNNLKNLYITTSLDADTRLISDASRLIVEKIQEQPGPDPVPDCCQKVRDWVAGCVAPKIITVMNENTFLLQKQIWSLVNVNNNIFGNQSPITEEKDFADNPYANVVVSPDYCDSVSLTTRMQEGEQVAKASSFDTRFIDDSISFVNGKFGVMQYNGFNQSGLGNITLEVLGGSYFWENSLLVDLYAALELPTAASINNSNSYLAVGIGNNKHYVGRFGVQGFYDIDSGMHFRFSTKMYLERGFTAMEKLVPQFEDYPVFGLNPVKMDTEVGWNGGSIYVDGSWYANDYAGLTMSYQYWAKGNDSIVMQSKKDILIPNMPVGEDPYVTPTYQGVIEISSRRSHTCGITFFNRVTNEMFVNCGMSRVVAGRNVPQVFDIFCSLGLSY